MDQMLLARLGSPTIVAVFFVSAVTLIFSFQYFSGWFASANGVGKTLLKALLMANHLFLLPPLVLLSMRDHPSTSL